MKAYSVQKSKEPLSFQTFGFVLGKSIVQTSDCRLADSAENCVASFDLFNECWNRTFKEATISSIHKISHFTLTIFLIFNATKHVVNEASFRKL
jgi:hypothetical protein